MKKTIVLLILILFLSNIVDAEIIVNSEEVNIPNKKPMLAGLLSLTIPGGGQVYNNSWINFGTVVALEGTFAGLAISSQ